MRGSAGLAVLFGMVAALGAGGLAWSAPGETVGSALAVRGEVTRTPEGEGERRLAPGGAIAWRDAIATGAGGAARLGFLDETRLDLGPSAALRIDAYVFDPERRAARLSLAFLRGGLRLVTGLLAAIGAERAEIILPVGSVGIRGTKVELIALPGRFYALFVAASPGSTGAGDVTCRNALTRLVLPGPGHACRFDVDAGTLTAIPIDAALRAAATAMIEGAPGEGPADEAVGGASRRAGKVLPTAGAGGGANSLN